MFKNISRLTGSLVAVTFLLTGLNATPANAETEPRSHSVINTWKDTKQLLNESYAELVKKTEEVQERTSKDNKSKADTENITELEEKITETVTSVLEDPFTKAEMFGKMFLYYSSETLTRDSIRILKEKETHLHKLEELAKEWEEAVKAENDRIRKEEEEEARKAAEEEARRLAEEAARSAVTSNTNYSPGTSTPTAPQAQPPAPVQTAESADQRIQRLMSRAGISIGYQIGTGGCGNNASNVLGCYTTGDNFISISPRALSRDDCSVTQVITHEYRHYQQWIQGLVQWGDNGVSNRDWLEADANAHTYC